MSNLTMLQGYQDLIMSTMIPLDGEMWLLEGAFTLSTDLVEGDLTECTIAGYSRKTFLASDWTDNGDGTYSLGTQTFSGFTGEGTVTGYYIKLNGNAAFVSTLNESVVAGSILSITPTTGTKSSPPNVVSEPEVPTTSFLLAPAAASIAGDPIVPSVYYISDDSGATYTSGNAISTLGFDRSARLADKTLSLFKDPSAVLDSQIGIFDGTSWTYDTDANYDSLFNMGDVAVRRAGTTVESTSDGDAWTAITGATGFPELGAYDGTNYTFWDGSNLITSTSSSGAFTAMTNQPSGGFTYITGVTGAIVTVFMDATTAPTYQVTTDAGATAWAAGGTSAITATEASARSLFGFDGDIFSVILEDDFSGGYIEVSSDSGATWTEVTVPGTSLLPLYMGSDGTDVFLSLAGSSDGFTTFTSYTSKWNGTAFDTPVQVSTGVAYFIDAVQGV